MVPGVTAALAAASYAGIPITHRDEASAVALVTGHEDAEKTDSTLDFAALARFPGTLVFYMGVTTALHWSRALIAAGKPGTTPVAILRRVSLPDQQRIDTTLGEVAAVVQAHKLRPPVVFVVGEVAARDAGWSWFEQRPLIGQRVLVTRPAQQADDLARPLADLGAEVLLQPAIEIRPPDDWSAVDRAIERLDQFDWLVFSSSNGVRMMLERLMASGVREHPDDNDASLDVAIGRLTPPARRDLRVLGSVKLAAIGPGTAEALARYHLRADLVPNEFRAEALALALKGGAAGKRFLLVRASRGREVLAEELTKAGAIVEQVVVYDSVDVAAPSTEVAEQMAAGRIDWTTVTSSAIARSLARLFGESLHQTRLASISPITSETLRELGYEPAAEAQEYTLEGVVEAITNSRISGG
jgi:uroporphyrinogen III methyltransferase/synthase